AVLTLVHPAILSSRFIVVAADIAPPGHHMTISLAGRQGRPGAGRRQRRSPQFRSGTLIGLQLRRPDSKHSSVRRESTMALTSQMPTPMNIAAATSRKMLVGRGVRL